MTELLLNRARSFISAAPSMHGEGEAHTIIRQLIEELERRCDHPELEAVSRTSGYASDSISRCKKCGATNITVTGG